MTLVGGSRVSGWLLATSNIEDLPAYESLPRDVKPIDAMAYSTYKLTTITKRFSL